MNQRFFHSMIAATLLLACASYAQDSEYSCILHAKPMFKAGPNSHWNWLQRLPLLLAWFSGMAASRI